MKLLFLLNIDMCVPGPSVHLLNDIINKAAEDPDNEIVVISKSSGEKKAVPSFVEKENVRFIEIAAESKKASFIKRYINDIKYARKCVDAYKNAEFDSVFLQSCNTSYFHIKSLRRKTKARVLYNVQDIFPENLKYIKKLPFEAVSYPLFSSLQKKAYKKADSIVTISEDMAEVIKGKIKDKNKVSVIHNWGYTDEISVIDKEDNPFYKENIFNREKFNVVYAGNIGLMQNVDIVVKAAAILKDNKNIHFNIIGNGARKAHIEEFVRENALENVTFLPMQDESKAPFIYSAADVNVVPLEPDIIKTALPSKTPACLTSGRALIACIEKESEFAEILKKAEGCSVVSNTDAKELAEKIEELAESRKTIFTNREEAIKIFSRETNPGLYVKELMKKSKVFALETYL